MIESTQVVAYGRPATKALAAAVSQAQQGNPLAPVTVVVPSNFVGLSARRVLGAGLVNVGDRVGLANVSFVTPFQLAEQVAADLLLDTRPITNPVLGAAVRRVLATEPGPYAAVAQHEATEAALAALFAELSNVDVEGLRSIAQLDAESATLAVEFYTKIAAHLDGFHTERDLALAAAECGDLAERLERFGHVVWFLPEPSSSALALFIDRALNASVSSSVIVGLSGSGEADEPVKRVCAAANVALVGADGSDVEVVVGDRIVSVTDAAEEVRETCARILELIDSGVAAERIAVFFPAPDPYVRILQQQFEAAGVPANGPNPRRVSDTVAGRTLLGALRLPDERWRRDRVLALVSGGPVRSGDGWARPGDWDVVSREAGVIADVGDWHAKLDRRIASTRTQLDELSEVDEGDGWRRGKLVRRLEEIDALRTFFDGLVDAVKSVERAGSWSERSDAAIELLRQLLGGEHQLGTWPDAEHQAYGKVEAALVRLGALDDIEPEPSFDVFRRALSNELDVARSRRGRFGQGVLYAPLASATGHDVDAVFVLGAAEGVLPSPRRDDAVLPEQVRIHSLDQLESNGDRLRHQHRAFLAAVGSAPAGMRTIMFPRGSLRSNRRALPSRWLLDTASALNGSVVHATEFERLSDDVIEVVQSFAAGVAASRMPTSVDERDVVAMQSAVRAGAVPHEHPLAALTAGGMRMQRERASARFSEFDGNLSGANTRLDDRPVSPSRLETWAACGFRYFLQYVLDVSDRDDPERTDDISALDRGSMLHEVLERFIAEAIERGAPEPAVKWTAADRARLHEIAGELAERYESEGRTGRAVNWRVRRADMARMLDAFVEVDNRFRAAHGATPTEVELDFGVRRGVPVPIELDNGRRLLMRGLADRVDTTSDGRVVVSDYKSGRGAKYDAMSDDPFMGGTGLQLGMYAEGALRHSGADAAAASYWLIEAEGNERRGYSWTDDLRARFREVLAVITDGIDSGVFAANPGDWSTFRLTNENCAYCEFDRLCVRDRGDQALAKAGAPEVQVRLRLAAELDES